MRPSEPLPPSAVVPVVVTWRPLWSLPSGRQERALLYGGGVGVRRVAHLMRRESDGVVCGIVEGLPGFDLRDVFSHWAPDPHPSLARPTDRRHSAPRSFAAVFCAVGLVGVAVTGTASPAAAQPFALGMVTACVAALVAVFAVSQGAPRG